MNEFTFTNDPQPEEEEEFNFSSPEDVLVHVLQEGEQLFDWSSHFIDSCTILNPSNGAASYEQSYGGFLDYTIEGLIDCPGEGWFVVQGITAVYYKGDGWMTDDDMEFDCKGVRPATDAEREMA